MAGVVGTVAAVVVALMAVQVARLDTRFSNLTALPARQGISAAEQAALLDPSTRRVVLVGATGASAAEMVLVRDGISYFVNVHMGELSPSRTYQLWAVTGTTAVSLGLLGRGPSIVPFVVNPARPPTRLAVTVERAAGVVSPTSKPVAVSAITT